MNHLLVKRLIKEFLKHYKQKVPSDLKVTDWLFEDYNVEYTSVVTGEGESTRFVITEDKDSYTIGLVPDYEAIVKASSGLLDFTEEVDFDMALEGFYDYVGNNTIPIQELIIPKGKKFPSSHRSNVDNTFDEAFPNQDDDELILRWYTQEVALSIFLDQTGKHMANQIMKGGFETSIEEAMDFIYQTTDPEKGGDDNIGNIIERIKEFSHR